MYTNCVDSACSDNIPHVLGTIAAAAAAAAANKLSTTSDR